MQQYKPPGWGGLYCLMLEQLPLQVKPGPKRGRVLKETLLVHSLYAICVNFVSSRGDVGFATGGHAASCSFGSELFWHVSVNTIGLFGSELVCGHQDFVSHALVAVLIVVAVVNNTVNVLIQIWSALSLNSNR